MAENLKICNQKISDKEVDKRVKFAVKFDIEKKKAMGLPVAIFDSKTGEVYAEYIDGKKILMGSRINKGSYGE